MTMQMNRPIDITASNMLINTQNSFYAQNSTFQDSIQPHLQNQMLGQQFGIEIQNQFINNQTQIAINQSQSIGISQIIPSGPSQQMAPIFNSIQQNPVISVNMNGTQSNSQIPINPQVKVMSEIEFYDYKQRLKKEYLTKYLLFIIKLKMIFL